jgi:hypothetical protein
MQTLLALKKAIYIVGVFLRYSLSALFTYHSIRTAAFQTSSTGRDPSAAGHTKRWCADYQHLIQLRVL